MKTLMLLLVISGSLSSFRDAVLFLTGADCFEELDSQVLEHYEALRSKPLDINSSPQNKLLASGLFSSFQVASLMDYRNRTGDILSFPELSMLDGFTPAYAEALKPFVTLRTSSPPGHRHSKSMSNLLESKVKYNSGDFSAAGKYSISVGDVFDGGISSSGTFSLAYYSRKFPATLILGDFNARFGQGLSMWSGFSMSGVPSVSSFRKNGYGFSPSTGYSSSSHRGVGTELVFGKFIVSAGISLPGLRDIMSGKEGGVSCLPVASFSYTGRKLSVGMCAHSLISSGKFSSTVSSDFRVGLPSCSIFGEAALNYNSGTKSFSGAVCAGTIWTPAYGRRWSLLARYYAPGYDGLFSAPVASSSGCSDEAGVSAGVSLRGFECTLDCSFRPSDMSPQIKAVCAASRQFLLWDKVNVVPSVRVVARYKPEEYKRIKTDLRANLTLTVSDWSASARYNTVFYVSRSWLWYAELGWKKNFLRFSLFKADDWPDRIYAYERSAPGNFSVPFFYGRGYKVSLYSSWKIGRAHSLYFSASYVSYPWSVKPKDSCLVLQVQYSLSLFLSGKKVILCP